MSNSARYALGGSAAAAAFMVAPEGGRVQSLVFLAPLLVSVGLVARAIRHLPGRKRQPWLFLIAGLATYAGTTVAWYVLPVWIDATLPYPSFLDAAFFASYALFGVALVALCRRAGGDDPAGVALDAVAVAAAAGAVVQVFLVEPVATSGITGLARAASIAYPVALVGMAAIGLRLVLLGVMRSGPGVLLMLWIAGELVGDFWYARSSLDGTFHYGHPMFVAWSISYVALGALALQPGLGEVASGATRAVQPGRRLVALATAVAVPLGLLVVDNHPVGTWQHAGRAGWVVVMVAAFVLRVRGLLRDVAVERRLREDVERLAAEVRHAASHDYLTGLANRGAFGHAVRHALGTPDGPNGALGLLMVDLEGFKAVNDTYGHPVGDDVLREVASRLRSFDSQAQLVARVGGNEFALVLHDTDTAVAQALAERVVATLAEPVRLAEVMVHPVVRIGVHVPEPWETKHDALLRADAALHAAKAASRGFELFDGVAHRRFVDRYEIELQVRLAPAKGELVLHYQPLIDLSTRRIVGSEALVRWNHPTRGLLAPGAFIQIAEESGAVVDLGRWVLRRACADARRWQEIVPGSGDVGVAVNVSRRQLASPAIVDDVRDAVAASGLPAASLTVEITETTLMGDTGETVDLLERFKALGAQLAMDDFGTGYSSLAQLRALPIDVLKVDKAFVDGIARDDEEWALAAAIFRLAASLGKRTVAEGVEEPSQLAHLRALGCERVQGYLFSRPVPLADFERLLAEQATTAPAP